MLISNAAAVVCNTGHRFLPPPSALTPVMLQATSISPWVVTMDALEPFRSEQAALPIAALPHKQGNLPATVCMLTVGLLANVWLTLHISINPGLSLHLDATFPLLLQPHSQHL